MAYDGAYNVCNEALAVRISGVWAKRYADWDDRAKPAAQPFLLPACIPTSAAAELQDMYKAAKATFR